MSEQDSTSNGCEKSYRGLYIAAGVWWYVWGVKGFWWGVLYGLGWPAWLGYRVAEYAMRHQ